MTATRFSSIVKSASQLVLASSLLLSAYGCASTTDSFTYAKNAYREGMALYQEGDYIDASAAFNNATRQDPRDYNSYFYLGASYQAMGSYQQAISAYRSCMSTMPLTLAGKQDTAMQHRVMDTLAQAIARSATCGEEIASMEKKAARDNSLDQLWLLAKVYRYSGDADAAVETYNKAVLVDPTRFEITKEAGLYEAALGQNDKAAQTLKKAYIVKTDDDQVNDALHKLGVTVTPAQRDFTLSHM